MSPWKLLDAADDGWTVDEVVFAVHGPEPCGMGPHRSPASQQALLLQHRKLSFQTAERKRKKWSSFDRNFYFKLSQPSLANLQVDITEPATVSRSFHLGSV